MPELNTVLAEFDPVTEADAVARYSRDWPQDITGKASAILRPRNTAEVARIVTLCAEAGIAMLPQGGHTGLVQGGTPTEEGNEVVISLERLNRVRSIDPANFSMVVEAGCILESVQQAAAAADRLFPLSLGAQGSCQIGGNVATNAGGVNVLRYGMMRNLVLGLEVVLPDGRVWNGLKALHKDNTGYDIKQLFVGSEGTLGIVTAACLKLSPRPTQVVTAFLAVESIEAAIALYSLARRDLSDLLSAFEFLPRACLELAVEVTPNLRDPLTSPAPHYVLMEVAASGLVDLAALVERFLEIVVEQGHVLDGAVATSTAQARDFWRIREGLVEGQQRRGRHLRTDVSVPISQMAALINASHEAVAAVAPEAIRLAYGHVGDGNVHFNVLPPQELSEEAKTALMHRAELAIFEAVDRLDGSISAEHGIGLLKRPFFEERIGPVEQKLIAGVKSVFDPAGLMSPGRIVGKLPHG